MQLRTLTRLSAAAALVLGVAGGVLTALAPVGALEQETVTLSEAGEFVFDYAPIVGMNPGGNVDSSTFYDETTCSGAGCDLIPLSIKTPPTAEGGEFFVTLSLEWDTQEVQNVPVFGEYTVNDLDMYLLNNPRVDGAGPDEDGFAYKSAGTSQPEQVNMYAPAGEWNILIVNATGPNTGYRLKFKVITDDIPSGIFESLPPVFSAGAPIVRPTPTTIPAASFDVSPPPPVDIAPATPPVADTSFDSDFEDTKSLEDQLAVAPEVTELRPTAASRPSAPSSLALLLWMAALPLALVALVGGFLARRQRAMLPGLS